MSTSRLEKIVLVTGANQGLGEVIAWRLAQQPGRHVLIGSRDLSHGEATASAINAAKGLAMAIQIDVSDDASIRHARQR